MKKKIISMMLILCMLLICCACGKTTPPEPDTDESSSIVPETPLDAFMLKLAGGNYVLTCTRKITTVVYKTDQVRYEFDPETGLETYAYVTLNGETFAGFLSDSGFEYGVDFIAPTNAIEAVGESLPNYLIELAGGNPYNLFYGSEDKPLEYVSYDRNAIITMLRAAGYNDISFDYFNELQMTFDAEDPTTVHFYSPMEGGGMITYPDLDITLTFGNAESDPRVDAWLKNPVYPPVRTGWTKGDISTIEIVFQRDYGAVSLPYPEFGSYALIFSQKMYDMYGEIYCSDAHATEENVESYKKTLLAEGFSEETDIWFDGSEVPVYRKLIRPEHNTYSELYVHYDNGLVIEGRKYNYKTPYDGRDAINALLKQEGFPELPESENFISWYAEETSDYQTESWDYFFDYSFYLAFPLPYKDRNEALKYFNDYSAIMLAAGYKSTYEPGVENTSFYSPDDVKSLQMYLDSQEDYLVFIFKSESQLSADEINAMLAEHGFPDANFHGDVTSRDMTRYSHNISGFKGLHIDITQPYGSAAEAEAFLDGYVETLDELGYISIPPTKINVYKDFLYINEDIGKYVAFTLIRDGDAASVTIEFNSAEPDEVSLNFSFLK